MTFYSASEVRELMAQAYIQGGIDRVSAQAQRAVLFADDLLASTKQSAQTVASIVEDIAHAASMNGLHTGAVDDALAVYAALHGAAWPSP